MEITDVINTITKNFFLSILTYFVAIKIINYKENTFKRTIVITSFSIFNALVYVICMKYIEQTFITLIIYFILGIATSRVINERISVSIIVTYISSSIVSATNIISILLSSFILKILIPDIQSKNITILLLSIAIEVFLIYRFFQIRRFKNGILFFQNKVNNVDITALAFISTTIAIYSLFGSFRGAVFNTYLIIAIIIELICMIIWIRRKITKFYKQKLKEQTIGELTNDLRERDELIDKISRENKALATINHKYSSRIDALENFTRKIAINPELVEKFRTEFGVDFTEIQEQIDTLSKEYSEEVNSVRKFNENISKTGIFGIDNLLEYLKNEAIKNDIKFQLNINENITKFIEEHIPQNKLEILLGDHIKDAIIAIKSSQKLEKEILVKFENSEIHIYDTGIEFEINTLLKLGLEQVTTHKATGGSGIGFMTTLETLKIYKASLEIEEMLEGKYTKAVRIIFDGLNEYRIKTYRKKEIQIQEGSERIKFIE